MIDENGETDIIPRVNNDNNNTRRVTLEDALKSKSATRTYLLMTIDRIDKTLGSLPCNSHDKRIDTLEKCKAQVKTGIGTIRIVWVVIVAIVGGISGLVGVGLAIWSMLR